MENLVSKHKKHAITQPQIGETCNHSTHKLKDSIQTSGRHNNQTKKISNLDREIPRESTFLQGTLRKRSLHHRRPSSTSRSVVPTIEEHQHPIHCTPPEQQHSLSEQGRYLLECKEPIQFFEAIYCPYEINSQVKQTNIHRIQRRFFQFNKVIYEEMRC